MRSWYGRHTDCALMGQAPAGGFVADRASWEMLWRAWRGEDFAHAGVRWHIPRVRVWPAPLRPPAEVLLHAVNSPESMRRAIERGLPAIMARPLSPFDEQIVELASYRSALLAATRGRLRSDGISAGHLLQRHC